MIHSLKETLYKASMDLSKLVEIDNGDVMYDVAKIIESNGCVWQMPGDVLIIVGTGNQVDQATADLTGLRYGKDASKESEAAAKAVRDAASQVDHFEELF